MLGAAGLVLGWCWVVPIGVEWVLVWHKMVLGGARW